MTAAAPTSVADAAVPAGKRRRPNLATISCRLREDGHARASEYRMFGRRDTEGFIVCASTSPGVAVVLTSHSYADAQQVHDTALAEYAETLTAAGYHVTTVRGPNSDRPQKLLISPWEANHD